MYKRDRKNDHVVAKSEIAICLSDKLSQNHFSRLFEFCIVKFLISGWNLSIWDYFRKTDCLWFRRRIRIVNVKFILLKTHSIYDHVQQVSNWIGAKSKNNLKIDHIRCNLLGLPPRQLMIQICSHLLSLSSSDVANFNRT